MKTTRRTKWTFIALIGIIASTVAQPKDSKISLHALSVNLGSAFYADQAGLSAGFDLDLASGEHIFKIMAMGTTALGILTDDPLGNASYSVLYGRESILNLGARSGIDAFAGLGYVRYEVNGPLSKPNRDVHSLGFPLQLKFRYQAGEQIGLGVQTNANFHAGPDILTTGFFLQYRF